MQPISTIGAGCLLQDGDSVLLVQPNYGPAKGGWIFPGGFLEPGETPVECALRELKEETGQIGIEATPLCVRYRIKPTDIYWVFRCKRSSPLPIVVDERELLAAKFWNIEQALRAPEVRPMTRFFLSRAFRGSADESLLSEEIRLNNVTYWFA